MTLRPDETWHRLLNWTHAQASSERLAAQVLHAEGFRDIDPSHPLGGPDGGKDAVAERDGKRWIMAVYFPRGGQPFREIKSKFLSDWTGVAANEVDGMVFVTNQELRLAERKGLADSVDGLTELFHLERLAGILDRPDMETVRARFLFIGPSAGKELLRPPARVRELAAVEAFYVTVQSLVQVSAGNGSPRLWAISSSRR